MNNEKIVITKEHEKDNFVLLNVYTGTKEKLKELSKVTGRPMADLAGILLDFAIERVEIKEVNDER